MHKPGSCVITPFVKTDNENSTGIVCIWMNGKKEKYALHHKYLSKISRKEEQYYCSMICSEVIMSQSVYLQLAQITSHISTHAECGPLNISLFRSCGMN